MGDINGYAPVVDTLESWRDAGVLDAPEHISTLADLVERLMLDGQELREQVKSLSQQLVSQTDVAKAIQETASSLKDVAAGKSHLELPQGLIDKLNAGPPQVEVNAPVSMEAPVVNVPVRELAKVLGDLLLPVLKAIAKRPDPIAPTVKVDGSRISVDMTSVAKAISDMRGLVERLPQPAPPMDLSPITALAEAVEGQTKAIKKAIEATKPQDLTPILKAIGDSNELAVKAIEKAGYRPPQAKQKRLTQDYATGDWIVSTEG